MTEVEEAAIELLHMAAKSEAGISIRVNGDTARAASALRKVAKGLGLDYLSVRRVSDPNELWIVRVIDVK